MKYALLAALILIASCTSTHRGEASWAIQGEVSHLDCGTQPGTHPWYNNVSPDQRFFMGCRFDAPVITAPAASDPDAPPMPPEFVELLKRILPRSSSEWHRFSTLHEAVMYGAERLEKCSHYYECSGYITVDSAGKFVMSPVRTDYNSDNVRIDDDTNPSDWKIVADLHSHPCVPHHYTGLFSPEDMIGSMTTRTTAYMVDQCTGDVHEFIPGTTKPDEVSISDGEWLSAGKVVGKVAAFHDEPIANEGL